ncbi:MAG: diadenosine tetraphosphate hydrolase [Thermoplasmata archaeon]|nr:MAG: diadenosine tetraphosphate hydrolase [Thermoplasmata archaeon]HDN96282.1 NUDIX domain-containing protein [Thermoplasmatales archaeon]
MPVERSCGAVIFKDKKYLLLKYEWGHWGFVKGNIEKGETLEQTFLREAEEEAGLKKEDLEIIYGFNEKISYYYRREGKTIYKEVIYLLAESKTFDVKLSHEHTAYAWLPYEEALEKITYENDRNVLKKAHEFLKRIGKM